MKRLNDWRQQDDKELCQNSSPVNNTTISALFRERVNNAADMTDYNFSQTLKDSESPIWVVQLREQVECIQKEASLKDMRWWSQPTQPTLTMPVTFCTMVTPDLLVIRSDEMSKGSLWMSTYWLREQYHLGRPLRLIHSSFANITATQVVPHLVDLLNTCGCQLNLYEPINAGALMIITRFTVSFSQ
jgi:hypothetical protein